MKEIEIRKINEPVSLNDRNIEGYASVFNSLSHDLGGFKEIIHPNAFDGIIEKSNVFALLDHDKNKGILGRSKSGSLKLLIDEKGLKYSFNAPNTSLGNDVVEYIKRGDIDSSSFAFTCKSDKWEKQSDNSYIRTILEIDKLFDVSVVYDSAYPDATVAIKRFNEIQEADIKKLNEVIETIEEERNDVVEEMVEDVVEEMVEDVVEETIEDVEEIEEEEIKEEIEITDEVIEDNEERNITIDEVVEEKRNTNADINTAISQNRNLQKMENFKLINLLNDAVNHRSLEQYNDVLEAGKNSFRNLNSLGAIQLPFEYRSEIQATVAGAGLENVSTKKLNILEPLRENLTLVKAGAVLMTGLVGDVSIPLYSGSSVVWAGENVISTDGAGSFSEVKLQPKRLTAFIDVSKQFLMQDSNDAEAMLIRDLTNAIAEKLEATILGTVSGSTTAPDGLFAGTITNDFSASGITYPQLLGLEAELEAKKINNFKMIASPSAKYALKGLQATEGRFAMEGNEVDGHELYSTGLISNKKLIMGAWENLVIATWGGLGITIDEVSRAVYNEVRIVINVMVDAKVKRDAFVVAKI